MKILILGGMHGNEPLGPEIVKGFQKGPMKNIDVELANKLALRQNCRFIGKDLNRSFPGNDKSDCYEDRRAAELLKMCAKYDIVLDFHNTNCPNNDCTFVGQEAGSVLYDVSGWLGLDRVIVADYDCINKFARNCISIEISLDSHKNDAALWSEKIAKLAKLETLPKASSIEKFKFIYRITLDDAERLNLRQQKLVAFSPINSKLAKAMAVGSPAYPIFIADAYTPYNYGGLLNHLDV